MSHNIMMIHGMLAGGWCWENYKNFFEQNHYRCHTPTLRWHHYPLNSQPDPRLGTTSILDYVEDLETDIQQMDSLPIIIGHSMGGLIAQIIGSHQLAKALVLITPASPYGIPILKFSAVKMAFNVITPWRFWQKPMRSTFEEFAYFCANRLSFEEQQAVYNKLVWESGRAATEIGLWGFYRHSPIKIDESKINCPVLVIGATHDRIIPVSVVKKVAEKYRATYQEFPNHAHWIIGEAGWQEVAEYILAWLQNLEEPIHVR